MKVLVIGSGGREHALCWAIARSPLCTSLYCAPGNDGIAAHALCLPIGVEDTEALVACAREYAMDFVVVGPEAPLVTGLIDRFNALGIAAFGPTADAARLEGSKVFMKDLCVRYGIPTADFHCFCDSEAAYTYVREKGVPIVIKADGLAAGKGVTVAWTMDDAITAITESLITKRFSTAGAQIIIEDYLVGEEVSFFALVDGNHSLALDAAQDYKTAYDNDRGPNTGGMGAYSPLPFMTPNLEDKIMSDIINPLVRAMVTENRPFKGVLYAGLMVTSTAYGLEPKLLECNVRFGDPECQVLMVRLGSDLLAALMATREASLNTIELHWRSQAAVSVVLAAHGYPGDYTRGTKIGGLDVVAQEENVFVFHAATSRGNDQQWRAQGGRVLTVTALGTTLIEARRRVYEAIGQIDWPQGFYRRDIGARDGDFVRQR